MPCRCARVLVHVSLMITIMFLVFQIMFQNKIVKRREDEYNKLKKETEEKIKNLINARREERERLRKMIFYLQTEEERLTKLREEEEARKHEGISLISKPSVSIVCDCRDSLSIL